MRLAKFLIIPAVLLTACTAEFFDDLDKIGSVYWNPEIGLPIASGTFTIADYVDAVSSEVTVSQDANGVVVFEYTGEEVKSDMAEDMIAVPDQSFSNAINLDLTDISGFLTNLTFTKSFDYDFVVVPEAGSNDELDSMIFKSGILNIDINGDFPVSGQMDVIFSSITLAGQTLKRTYSWTHNPSNPGQAFIENIDLSDAFIDYTKNGTMANNFSFHIDLTINYQGQTITQANSLDIILTMTNPKFRIVYGKFAQRQFITDQQNVLLGILEKVDAKGFYLDDPQIDFNFKSSFGLPVTAKLTSLIATNSAGATLPFTGSIVTNTTSVASPSINEVGSFIETSIVINKDNSNIVDIIAFLPNELSYQFEGSVDPQGSTVEQFVLDTSQVIGSYTVRLPLSGRVEEFKSTKDFDFEGSDLDQLKQTKIILHTTNGLPLTVGVELVFLDINNNPIDTLFSGTNFLSPGTTDGNGFVTSATENTVEELISVEQIEKLKSTVKIRMISILNTGIDGTKNVKIRMQDEVKANIYIQTALSF
ncbi:MAG: hypothetical protein DRI71_11315 [Bacteroidetes bacterium]|nr:MAG: hypothetical protein DRI71_11315 [Bacteroidota bacterium]